MKKIIAILIISVLTLSLFSCKPNEESDEGVAELLDQQVQPEPEPPETDDKNEKEETQDKTEETQDKTEETQENMQETQEKTVVKSDGDAKKAGAKPANEEPDFTTDVPFSENEVVIVLTEEETAKGKTYTSADFPELDVFNVFENSNYIREFVNDQVFEESGYYGKTTLMLMLREPSKERVLEYIKILLKDPRVFDAFPNIVELNLLWFDVKFKDGYIYTDGIFSDIDLGGYEISEYSIEKRNDFTFVKYCMALGKGNSRSEQLQIFIELMKDPRVLYVLPDYRDIDATWGSISITFKDKQKPLKEYTAADFKQLKIKEIYYHTYHSDCCITIYFEPDIRYYFKAYRILAQDDRVEKVFLYRLYETIC